MAQHLQQRFLSGCICLWQFLQDRLNYAISHQDQALQCIILQFVLRRSVQLPMDILHFRQRTIHFPQQFHRDHPCFIRCFIILKQLQKSLFAGLSDHRNLFKQQVRHRCPFLTVSRQPVHQHLRIFKLCEITPGSHSAEPLRAGIQKRQIDARHIFFHLIEVFVILLMVLHPFRREIREMLIKVNNRHLHFFPASFSSSRSCSVVKKYLLWQKWQTSSAP